MNAARRQNLVDISEVSQMLAGRIQALVTELLPQGKRAGHEWTCGSPAGEPGTQMAVHLTGSKAGVWKHFAGTEGGDALDLVAAVLFHGDKSDALKWSRRWLGIDTGDAAALETARRPVPAQADLDRQAQAEVQEGRAAAKRVWLAAQANLTGTPVDWYLRGRAIDLGDLDRQPRALRFHPNLYHKPSGRSWPAMVAAISGPGGFLATHRTWLEVTGDGQARKAPVQPAKAVLGSYKGGHIALWRGESGKPLRDAREGETLDITEGIEDGLSVAVAVPESRVIAAVSLSNMAAIELPPAITSVRIWRQNDTKWQAIAAFERAMRAHLMKGREVLIPEIPKRYKDANDWLQAPTDE
jgi:hypothetical protein